MFISPRLRSSSLALASLSQVDRSAYRKPKGILVSRSIFKLLSENPLPPRVDWGVDPEAATLLLGPATPASVFVFFVFKPGEEFGGSIQSEESFPVGASIRTEESFP